MKQSSKRIEVVGMGMDAELQIPATSSKGIKKALRASTKKQSKMNGKEHSSKKASMASTKKQSSKASRKQQSKIVGIEEYTNWITK